MPIAGRMNRHVRMLCVVVALALSAAACSGGDDGASSVISPSANSEPTETTESAGADTEPEPELTFVTPGPSASATASPNASATAAVTPGRVFAFLKTVDVGARSVTYDQAEFLTGAAAAKAQKDAKVEDPLDFYIRNVNPRLRTATIAPDVVVLGSIVLSKQVNPMSATLEQLAALVASEKPSSTGFWLSIDAKGQVKKIEEQYVP
jgi:hypothetical protein